MTPPRLLHLRRRRDSLLLPLFSAEETEEELGLGNFPPKPWNFPCWQWRCPACWRNARQKLVVWKREFGKSHEKCREEKIISTFLDGFGCKKRGKGRQLGGRGVRNVIVVPI